MIPNPRSFFLPDQVWTDDRGIPINAHGGGVLFHAGVYYWFGEHKTQGDAAEVGVHVYASHDLYNWRDEGIALPVSDDPASEITRGCIIERPKVIHHAGTGKFIMWFHLEKKDEGRRAALSGIAVSDTPVGPYVFQKAVRPDAGVWPINATEEDKAGLAEARKLLGSSFVGSPHPDRARQNFLARDFEGGQMAKDMTLFVDDDERAYHVFSSEENATLHISLLSSDYQSHAGKWARAFPYLWHEAPAVCKHDGRYWMISSHCTGWHPNAARSAVADSIWGPWRELGNPCVGDAPPGRLGPDLTFGGQSTFILPVQGRPGAFIAMFDIWRPENHPTGGYAWLPVEFERDRLTIRWHDRWDLSIFD
ncbi:MAG: glycoside hydrolase family 43 protein [Candidatus Methylacidiphilales bacterium]|nr:glycoside hydrolase family 43 protein [Candidatus Methylacidiphilales bacterium]